MRYIALPRVPTCQSTRGDALSIVVPSSDWATFIMRVRRKIPIDWQRAHCVQHASQWTRNAPGIGTNKVHKKKEVPIEPLQEPSNPSPLAIREYSRSVGSTVEERLAALPPAS